MKKKRTSFIIKKWSKDDDDTLIEMYKNPNIKIKDIQEVLNRTESSISNRAHVLKLKKASFKDIKVEDGEKICRRCGQTKKYEQFYKNKGLKDGLNSWCIECSKEAKNQYLLNEATKKLEQDLANKEAFIKQEEGKIFECTMCKKILDVHSFPISKKYNQYVREA
ncbi:MAG: hypothetical protein IJH34_03650, partial [Romboutsia sp.]|nr:hypothetical protein [Romboutsia sp.]